MGRCWIHGQAGVLSALVRAGTPTARPQPSLIRGRVPPGPLGSSGVASSAVGRRLRRGRRPIRSRRHRRHPREGRTEPPHPGPSTRTARPSRNWASATDSIRRGTHRSSAATRTAGADTPDRETPTTGLDGRGARWRILACRSRKPLLTRRECHNIHYRQLVRVGTAVDPGPENDTDRGGAPAGRPARGCRYTEAPPGWR